MTKYQYNIIENNNDNLLYNIDENQILYDSYTRL